MQKEKDNTGGFEVLAQKLTVLVGSLIEKLDKDKVKADAILGTETQRNIIFALHVAEEEDFGPLNIQEITNLINLFGHIISYKNTFVQTRKLADMNILSIKDHPKTPAKIVSINKKGIKDYVAGLEANINIYKRLIKPKKWTFHTNPGRSILFLVQFWGNYLYDLWIPFSYEWAIMAWLWKQYAKSRS